MTKNIQMHKINLGARLLVSKAKDLPFAQYASQNREVLCIHTDKGDITFNFAPKTKAYTAIEQLEPNRPPILIYNSSNIPYLEILERRMGLGTIRAFEMSRELSQYKEQLRKIFEQSALAYITFTQEGPFDKIRLYHSKDDYKIEFGYKRGSLRGKISVISTPEDKDFVSPFMDDIPKAREDFISLEGYL